MRKRLQGIDKWTGVSYHELHACERTRTKPKDTGGKKIIEIEILRFLVIMFSTVFSTVYSILNVRFREIKSHYHNDRFFGVVLRGDGSWAH